MSLSSILYRVLELSTSVPDFRKTKKGNIRHKLSDILTLMILVRLCGHKVRTDIIALGMFNLERLRKIGLLAQGG